MTEDDKKSRRVIMQRWPESRFEDKNKWICQGYTWEPLVKTMWELYRDKKSS
jgi:hypothetical protein